MPQLKRDNHFVSQMYLKNWGDSKNFIWAYRLLVPNENFPKWKRLPIGGVAFQRDLYTIYSKGQEDDAHERWIESEFETPAQESFSKVLKEKKLTPLDWHRLAFFLAVQDVRTPLNYFDTTERWQRELPKLLDGVLKRTIHALEEHHRDGKPLPEVSQDSGLFDDVLEVSITRNAEPEKNLAEIRAGVVAGRKLWIQSQRYLLENTAKVLLKHKWSIVEPADGMSWFTSDHPVLRLNYYPDGTHDLRGGWGHDGGNLIMPLSPKHLLFAEIGSEFPDYFKFSIDKTYEIQTFLAERALRSIFAHKRLPSVFRIRPRDVNLAMFVHEETQWNTWHREQSSVENNKHSEAE
jgi:hypothetical protein